MPEERKQEQLPLHGSRIEDYAMIGDCETAALVSREGSIDWLCWPTFSSGACFAALLGTRDHGFWKIAPAGKITGIRRSYRPQTLIVDTTFTTEDGEVMLTDFMPPRGKHSHVIRIVRGLRGKVTMHMELAIRFDYGRSIPWVTKQGKQLHAIAGADMVVLRTEAPLTGEGMATESEFTVGAGKTMGFTLTSASSLEAVPDSPPCEQSLQETTEFWIEWMSQSTYRGRHQQIVDRSLMTLKALTYRPSGGIVAAVTSSLPEEIGGVRNWDYRYCWLRDTSFTLLVLMYAGYKEEAIAWRRWLLRAIAGSPEQVQTIYGICGERQLNEWTAPWLPGYENSAPVRFGNGAVDQFQLDVFGEVAAALARTPEAEDDIRVDAGSVQAKLINHLCQVWQQPDDGIWETRGGRKHFTHSKVMAWVALDRAIKHNERFGGRGDVTRWKKNRAMIHREVCEKGFDPEMNSFVQSYGSKELDASCLRIMLVGFLSPDDPRIRGTVEAIEHRLMRNGFVERYDPSTSSDGVEGGEGAFLACSFWLVSNLHLMGRVDDAREMFERLISTANDVGLIAEEYDPKGKRLLGNFPQALSHIALVHSALTIAGFWRPELFPERPA